jgi:HAD superfamily hydrolase (TIGR01549 family)
LVNDLLVGVMFDWDGVLLDSLGASFNVYNKIFARVGAKQLTKDEFFELQSPNWYEFYVKIGLQKSLWKEVDEDWVRFYQDERPGLYEDARPCLVALKEAGLKLALVTNGSKARVEAELDRLQVRAFFQSTMFGEKTEDLKPSPVMLRRTLNALGWRPEEVVYAGDAPVDVRAAKNAGVPSIAIARGPIQVSRLGVEDPDWVFNNLDDMTRFLVGRW